MDVTYMVRIGSREYLGDVMEWMNIGRIPSFSIEDLNLSVGMYSIQIMATASSNFSRVTQRTLKINDYNISHWSPAEALSYRGHGKGYSVDLINFGTFDDNVTIFVEGYLADEGWAYLDKSGGKQASYQLQSEKIAANPESIPVAITIYPEEDIEKRIYKVRLRIVSEDGETVFYTDYVDVNVKDKPRDNFGQAISDNLYDFLTDTFPFLKPIRQTLLVPLFFLFVAIIITLISGTGILIYRKKFRTEIKEDPYAQQRKLYRDLYGVNPTEEQLKTMVEEEEGGIDDFFSDIPDIHDDAAKSNIPDKEGEPSDEEEEMLASEEEEIEDRSEEEELEEIDELEEYLDPDDL
jgi:hypothetical protein